MNMNISQTFQNLTGKATRTLYYVTVDYDLFGQEEYDLVGQEEYDLVGQEEYDLFGQEEFHLL